MFSSNLNQKNKKRNLLVLFCLVFTSVILACGTTQVVEPTLDVGLIYTQAYESAIADFAIKSTETALALPTQTPIPTVTATSIPTNTPVWMGITNALCVPVENIETAKVVEIVDGDTIKVLLADKVYSVRYIGIDTPETGGEFYNSEATQKNTELVYGKVVSLVKDVSETDVYGRLLRYVIVDNSFVNHELVLNGYARASSYPPDTACDQGLKVAEQTAQTALIGIWQSPTQQPQFLVLPTDSISGNCDPSYPGVCIPPSPPDLDCKDISYRRFQVLPPDPHRFDGDDDGIGCES